MSRKSKRQQKRNKETPKPELPMPGGVDQRMPTEEKSQERGNERTRKSETLVSLFKNDPRFRVELGALVVGIFVLIVYACQLRQMIESNRINRDSLESVQRAFMVFKQIDETRMKDSTTGRVSWTFKPLYENSGTTPALYAVNVIDLGGGQGELPEKEFLAGSGSTSINPDTIGPKATRQGPSFDLDEAYIFGTFLGDKFENFRNVRPRGDVYFWGWMAYRDVFRETPIHVTEFCRHMIAPQLLATNDPKIMLNFENCSQQHNCTDEHCPDYNEVIKFAKPRMK